MAQDVAGPGQTWDGGGGANDDWTLGANWVGGVMPGRPATSVVTFNDTDVGNVNRLDSGLDAERRDDRGQHSGAHTMDLGGNTLTLNGGTLTVSSAHEPGAPRFTNGTLKTWRTSARRMCESAMAPDDYGTVTVNSAFWAQSQHRDGVHGIVDGRPGFGVLDLRGATPLQSTFAATP